MASTERSAFLSSVSRGLRGRLRGFRVIDFLLAPWIDNVRRASPRAAVPRMHQVQACTTAIDRACSSSLGRLSSPHRSSLERKVSLVELEIPELDERVSAASLHLPLSDVVSPYGVTDGPARVLLSAGTSV